MRGLSGSCIPGSVATRGSWPPSSRLRLPRDAAARCTRTTASSNAAGSWPSSWARPSGDDRVDVRRVRRHLAGVLGSDRVKEFSQWMVERSRAATPKGPRLDRAEVPAVNGGATAKPAGARLRIGLQDSCHLRNGLGVWREPRELLARVGEYVELPSAAACCGAAGSYSVVRAEDSARVLDPHLDEIAAADLDVIAVVNAGCYRQLEQGVKRRKLRTRVVHLAELLAAESDPAPHESSNGRAEIAPAMLAKEVHGGLGKAPKSPAHPR